MDVSLNIFSENYNLISYENDSLFSDLSFEKDKIINIDIEKYQYYNDQIKKRKELYTEDERTLAKFKCNHFEKLGNSIFMDRASVKIANIDYVFKLVKAKTRYFDICAGPGGFSQYVQYRDKESVGTGFTLKTQNQTLNWNFKLLDTERFEGLYGNIFTDYNILFERDKVDLVLADGGFEYEEGDDDFKKYLTVKLFFYQCFVAVNCLEENGDFCVKMFDSSSLYLQNIIYLTSFLFKEIYVFKPLSSRPANTEKYLICKKYINNNRALDIFKIIEKQFSKNEKINTLELPNSFNIFMEKCNNVILENSIQVQKTMNLYSQGKIDKIQNPYNLNKLFILWNIPFNNYVERDIEKNETCYLSFMRRAREKLLKIANVINIDDPNSIINENLFIGVFLKLEKDEYKSSFYSIKVYDNIYTKKIYDKDEFGILNRKIDGYEILETKSFKDIEIERDINFSPQEKILAYLHNYSIFKRI